MNDAVPPYVTNISILALLLVLGFNIVMPTLKFFREAPGLYASQIEKFQVSDIDYVDFRGTVLP